MTATTTPAPIEVPGPQDVLADLERERSLAEQILADLERARASRLDRLDLPGAMTQRQVSDHVAYTAKLDGVIQGSRSALQLLANDVARREPLLVSLGPLRKAEGTIDAMIADAPDLETISDPRAREAEAARQRTLAASKNALHRGVDFVNGLPALPTPLAALLTSTCVTCGHSETAWPGSIDALVEQIADLDARIGKARRQLAIYVGAAQALLAEPVSTS